MKAEIEEHIKRIDEGLDAMREGLMDATPPNREKWRVRIDKALDERLALMKTRNPQP